MTDSVSTSVNRAELIRFQRAVISAEGLSQVYWYVVYPPSMVGASFVDNMSNGSSPSHAERHILVTEHMSKELELIKNDDARREE